MVGVIESEQASSQPNSANRRLPTLASTLRCDSKAWQAERTCVESGPTLVDVDQSRKQRYFLVAWVSRKCRVMICILSCFLLVLFLSSPPTTTPPRPARYPPHRVRLPPPAPSFPPALFPPPPPGPALFPPPTTPLSGLPSCTHVLLSRGISFV